jgi:N-acetylglucosamine-6-phosphate deacetylase
MTDSSRQIFSGMQIYIDHKWVTNQAVLIEAGRIKAIIPTEMIEHHLPAKHHTYPKDYYLVPGFIDLHIHGIHGHDVMDAKQDSLQMISRELATQGVTGFLATTMTASDVDIEAVLKLIPAAMLSTAGAALLGVHLEGPFIAPAKMGAQRGDAVKAPDVALFKHWQSLADDAIKLVTIAPELPGAIPFIEALRKMDVIASIGHTNATYAETMAAIQAGATQATHLFNAMRGMHQREPGAAGALLLSDHIVAELIADNVHLHPAMMELALRVKGKEHLLLVTDAMRACCLHDGDYDLGGQSVHVNSGVARLADGTLAGSTLTMPHAIKNMAAIDASSLAIAIDMATHNPARALGLAASKGRVAVGYDADLVVLNADINVMATLRAGCEIYRR